MNLIKRENRDGTKFNYYFNFGRGKGQRPATNIFTYKKPACQVQKNHNKEALAILETMKSQAILDHIAIGSGYIPNHKFKSNFIDYYTEYVMDNKRPGKRHLESSLKQFKIFIKGSFIPPIDITERMCFNFRQYLLERFNGDTPMNYFSSFKKVITLATRQGYFKINPCEEVKAKSGKNPRLKEHLEAEEYIRLLNIPCINNEVREAFILSCYSGLRWCDIKILKWEDINGDDLQTNIMQSKTGRRLYITLHPIAKQILEKRKNSIELLEKKGLVFYLPTANGANEILKTWCGDAGINKHITWHCARLSFSILLQDANVDDATVALLLGHTSTKYVHSTYKRHRPKNQSEAIGRLPNFFPK